MPGWRTVLRPHANEPAWIYLAMIGRAVQVALGVLVAYVWASLVITYEYYDGDYPPTPTLASMTPKEALAFGIFAIAPPTLTVLAAASVFCFLRALAAWLFPRPRTTPPLVF